MATRRKTLTVTDLKTAVGMALDAMEAVDALPRDLPPEQFIQKRHDILQTAIIKIAVQGEASLKKR